MAINTRSVAEYFFGTRLRLITYNYILFSFLNIDQEPFLETSYVIIGPWMFPYLSKSILSILQ